MPTGIAITIGLNEVDPNHYVDGQGNPWSGRLNACENDARDLGELAKSLGFEWNGPLLTQHATSVAVKQQVAEIAGRLQPGDLFMLTYSGHGSQVANTNPEDDPEQDKLDETWCLYDREFLDDELFSLFSLFAPGVRVVVFSDSCHSGTVAKAAPGEPIDEFAVAKMLPLDVSTATEKKNEALYSQLQRDIPTKRLQSVAATVVLISGCQDNELSRDGRLNGAFTGALLEAWNDPDARRSLPKLRDKASELIPDAYNQHPNYSIYGFDTGPALVI